MHPKFVPLRSYVLVMSLVAAPAAAAAQGDPSAQQAPVHQHETQDPGPQQPQQPADQHAGHVMAGSLFTGRDNAGTAWTPARTPMLAAHRQAGPWSQMFMGNGFLQYLE